MSVSWFTCSNCHEVSSEYDRIYCEECETELCGCAIPKELKKYISIWENVWSCVQTDSEDNFIPIEEAEMLCEDNLPELFNKYLKYDGNTYGLVLRKEYCPICAKRAQFKEDPEYQEYLRLKKKFEG